MLTILIPLSLSLSQPLCQQTLRLWVRVRRSTKRREKVMRAGGGASWLFRCSTTCSHFVIFFSCPLMKFKCDLRFWCDCLAKVENKILSTYSNAAETTPFNYLFLSVSLLVRLSLFLSHLSPSPRRLFPPSLYFGRPRPRPLPPPPRRAPAGKTWFKLDPFCLSPLFVALFSFLLCLCRGCT